jgi:hypothetical protein
MNHQTCNFSNASVQHESQVLANGNGALTRRTFFRLLTGGTAAIVVQGCGGGMADGSSAVGGTPSAPPAVASAAVATAPIWQDIPSLTFTQGQAASIAISNFLNVERLAAFSLALNAESLPEGVTFNSVTQAFDYNGRGATADTTGHVLTATVG